MLKSMVLNFKVDEHEYIPSQNTLDIIKRIENGEEEMAGPFTYEEYKAWLHM